MKIILSHDVDHLYWNDHLIDTYIPGLFLRSSKELFAGKINLKIYINRLNPNRKLHNLEALVNTLQSYQVPAAFFFGMGKALNLSYSIKKATPLIQWIQKEGFEVGLHGIDYQCQEKMKWEKDQIANILKKAPKGIRNHYLRRDNQTFYNMASLGYEFDSTDYGIKKPYKVKTMWEMPISIMDVYVLKDTSIRSLNRYKKDTLDQLNEAQIKNLPYFIVNFHDVYYADAFPLMKEWFNWLLSYLVNEGFEFTDFSSALDELNSQENKSKSH